VDTWTLTWITLIVVLATLVGSVIIFVITLGHEEVRRQNELRAARARRLRYRKGDKEVILPKLGSREERLRKAYPNGQPETGGAKNGPFHIFLSHNWAHVCKG